MDIIVGGLALALWALMTCYIPRKLVRLSICVAEWFKPGIWYNRAIEKNTRDLEQIHTLWIAVIGGASAWCGLLYASPFLTSVIEGRVVVHPTIIWILTALLTIAIVRVAIELVIYSRRRPDLGRLRHFGGIVMPLYFGVGFIVGLWYYVFPILIGH